LKSQGSCEESFPSTPVSVASKKVSIKWRICSAACTVVP
jgi:hypothetical protein